MGLHIAFEWGPHTPPYDCGGGRIRISRTRPIRTNHIRFLLGLPRVQFCPCSAAASHRQALHPGRRNTGPRNGREARCADDPVWHYLLATHEWFADGARGNGRAICSGSDRQQVHCITEGEDVTCACWARELSLVPGKSNINASAMRTAIAAPNTRCDKGVIHGSGLFRGDPAPFVGQLDGTG
jgi:hypothetical protein